MTSHSYAEDGNEPSRLHPEVESLREQVTALIKSQSDETRSCHKVLTDQLISFDVRLRSLEKDGSTGPRLDMYQTQVDFEHKLLRHQQELKSLIGDVVRTEELKASEEAVKRANGLRIQTLEYRLKELGDSQEEIRAVLQNLLRKERNKDSINPENVANQIYATSVQRIDKLLERELVPLLNEQEQRLAAGIERRFALGKEEQRTSSRGEIELRQRVNLLDESFKALETSMLRSQSLASDAKRSLDGKEDVKMLEKALNQGLNQTKMEFQKAIGRLEGDLGVLSRKMEEISNVLEGKLESQFTAQKASIQTQMRAEIQPMQETFSQIRLSNGQTQREVELLRSDYVATLQQLAGLESRTKDIEAWVSSAQERSSDVLNQSIAIESTPDPSPAGLATFGELATVGKVAPQARMKGGIRGIQQLHLAESSPEESSRSATPGLTAEQITADIFEGLLGAELDHCLSLLKPQELVLSSLDSYRDMGRAAVSPLLSWDPDDEQDEGANLSDRRVDVRRFG